MIRVLRNTVTGKAVIIINHTSYKKKHLNELTSVYKVISIKLLWEALMNSRFDSDLIRIVHAFFTIYAG